MANTVLVPYGNKSSQRGDGLENVSKSATTQTRQRESAPFVSQTKASGTFDLSNRLTNSSKFLIESSLRESSKAKYNNYCIQFKKFCTANDITNIEIADVINFLSHLYDKGLSYSVIKSAKAALNQIVFLPPYSSIGDHPLLIRFMKGVFNNRPPKRKFGYVWDVKILFDYFKALGDNSTLSDKDLTYKLLIFLVLLGGQRIDTVFWFRTDELVLTDISATFAPSHVLKHSRINKKKLDIFEYRAYPDKTLCVIDCLL